MDVGLLLTEVDEHNGHDPAELKGQLAGPLGDWQVIPPSIKGK